MALQRFNASVLGPFKRPMPAWMAARMPARVARDHLTVLGICGALLAASGYILSRESLLWLWLAAAGILIRWIGDSVDVTVARCRKIGRRRHGFFVDHCIDLFGNVVAFLSLGMSLCAHFAIACLGLIAFLMGFVFTLIGAQDHSSMRFTLFGFGPMALWPFDRYGPLSTYDLGILILACACALLIASLGVGESRALALGDPPRTTR